MAVFFPEDFVVDCWVTVFFGFVVFFWDNAGSDMMTASMNSRIVLLRLIEVSFHHVFVGIAVQSYEARDEPSTVIACTIEIGQLKIPSVDLEEVELHPLHRLKFDVAFPELIEKQGQVVGAIALDGKLCQAIGV